MSGYENSPQAKMVATHCAACGRPLVDAVSVETGMGPDCRARLLGSIDVPEEARQEANKLVYQIAVIQKGVEIFEPLMRLRELGFVKLADRIEKRCKMKPQVFITEMDGCLVVRTPYLLEAGRAWRNIPGRRWEKIPGHEYKKANIIPMAQKRAVWNLLLTYYHGLLAEGPKGQFVIDKKAGK
jgi:hypothetical protein